MKAVYPGSFDPVTNGHIDIIRRASALSEELVVAVLRNTSKTPLFTIDERVEALKKATADLPNVRIASFSGLLIDFMKQEGIPVIIKGLRAMSDFEAEFQMALMNQKLCPDAETIFLPTANDHSYISSSLVKEIFKLGGNVDELVPPVVNEMLKEKLREVSHAGTRAAE